MVNDRLLKVGVVGLGVGERHARAADSHPRSYVGCLFDFDLNKSNNLARQLKSQCRVARSYEELLYSADIDAVIIASNDNDHYVQVMAALRAGKHVFVEKPICENLDELREIKALWHSLKGELLLRSNLILRAAPYYKWLKKLIHEGELGAVYSIDGDYLYGRLHKITDGWRSKSLNYSVIKGGGIHLIDLIMWILGERPIQVTTVGNNICSRDSSFKYLDFTSSTFEFQSGVVARVTANFGCVHRHHHVLRVFGTNASAIYDDQGPRLHRSRDPKADSENVSLSALPSDKGDLIPEFLDAVVSRNHCPKVTESVFESLTACIHADIAAKSGAKERICYY